MYFPNAAVGILILRTGELILYCAIKREYKIQLVNLLKYLSTGIIKMFIV